MSRSRRRSPDVGWTRQRSFLFPETAGNAGCGGRPPLAVAVLQEAFSRWQGSAQADLFRWSSCLDGLSTAAICSAAAGPVTEPVMRCVNSSGFAWSTPAVTGIPPCRLALYRREGRTWRFGALLPHLDERQRRLLLGAEARWLGHGGIELVARASGVSRGHGVAGRAELEAGAGAAGERAAGRAGAASRWPS